MVKQELIIPPTLGGVLAEDNKYPQQLTTLLNLGSLHVGADALKGVN